MGYHHPRFYRTDPSSHWLAVGADNKHLLPICDKMLAGIEGIQLQVKLTSGQVVRFKRKPGLVTLGLSIGDLAETFRRVGEVARTHGPRAENLRLTP